MITPGFSVAEQNVSHNFTISWDEGTDVVITMAYGDGNSFVWAWDEQNHTLSYRYKVITLGHSYLTLANVTVTVTASNQVGSHVTTAEVAVEPNLAAYIGMTLFYTPGPTDLDVDFSFGLLPSVTSPFPILIWCNMSYDDPSSATTNTAEFGVIDDTPFITSHIYETDRSQSNPSAVCFNHISSTTFSDVVILRENITSLNITAERIAWMTVDEMVLFNVTMATGSHANFYVQYDDGTEENATHPNRISHSEPMNFEHLYQTPANYTITVTAYNEYFQDTTSHVFILQNKVQGITVASIPPVAFPPGLFTMSLDSSGAVRIPTDVWINATLSGRMVLGDTYSEALSAGAVQSNTITVDRSFCGENLELTILCHNLASEQVVQTTLSIYETITGLSITPVPKTSLPNETWALHITVATGSFVTYTVDFDDGDQRTVVHELLFASDQLIILFKNYTYVDNYTVTVTATNPVSSQTTSFLHEWSCYPPNITIAEEFLDEVNPPQVYKAKPFQLEPELYLVCIDTQVVLYHWTVLDYNSRSLLPFESHEEIFYLPPRTLHYGKYIIRLNTSMLNEANTIAIVETFIEVIRTPLVASIVGGAETGIVFGHTAFIDGFKDSFDLDEEPVNQRNGLTYRYNL